MLYLDFTNEATDTKKIYKVYADNILNKNYMSTFDTEHDNVITQEYELTDIINIDLTNKPNKAYIVTVLIHDDEDQTDSQIVKFVVDEEFLYHNIVNMLISTCDRCTSDTWKYKTLMCNFRLKLLQYAIQHDKLNDCIQFCIDLFRILGIDDKLHYSYISNNKRLDCNKCSNCDNCNCINEENMFNSLHRWIDVI